MTYLPVGTQPITPALQSNAQLNSVMVPVSSAVTKAVGTNAIKGVLANSAPSGLIAPSGTTVWGSSLGGSTATDLTALNGVGASGETAGAAASTGPGAAAYGVAGIAGYWGGAKIASMLGENPTGGSIGGASGAMYGAYVGSTVPGVGTVAGALVGGILGSIGGSFLGPNKPSDFTQAGGINLSTGSIESRYAKQESSTGKKFNSQVASLRDNIQQGATAFTKFLQDNGATLKNPDEAQDMLFIVGGRDGFRTAVMPSGWDRSQRVEEQKLPEYKKYGKDFKGYSNGITSDISSRYNIPPELQKKLDEKKTNGELDDITTFGQKNYGDTYAQDLIKSTRVDVMIEKKKESNTKWADFLKSYNEKYING
jgi:hypothetical protein